MRISDWSSDVCSSDLDANRGFQRVTRSIREVSGDDDVMVRLSGALLDDEERHAGAAEQAVDSPVQKDWRSTVLSRRTRPRNVSWAMPTTIKSKCSASAVCAIASAGSPSRISSVASSEERWDGEGRFSRVKYGW